MAYLQNYSWPGNIRELANFLQKCSVLFSGQTLNVRDVMPLMPEFQSETPAERDQGSFWDNMPSAKIGVWFNSSNSLFIQKIVTDRGIDFKELPALPKFGQGIEDIGKQTKENLVATHNLKAVFNSIRSYIAGNSVGTQRDERIASNMINLIFVKIYDERYTKPNELLKFRASYNEELYRQWRDSRSDWDTEARKDIDFYLGNHFHI